jgi:hypothetical protein
MASAQLACASSEGQAKELKEEIKALKKEAEKLQSALKLLQDRERVLREKLTEPRSPQKGVKKVKATVVNTDGEMQQVRTGSKSSVTEEPEARGAFLKDLLAVLRAQMLLSTPPEGASRQWGRPIDCRALVAPTGDKDLAKIVALLNGHDVENESTNVSTICASEESIPSSADYSRRLCRGAPSANSRRSPHSADQYWLLAPPSAGSEGLGQKSRSCTDLNSTSQSWASFGSDSKTVSMRMFDKPPGRDFLKRSSPMERRPQSTASGVGKWVPPTLGLSKCSICGLGGGTDQCLECQSTVPKLSVGWCLPPLASEQSVSGTK